MKENKIEEKVWELCMLQREKTEAVKAVMKMNSEGKSEKPKKKWLDAIGYGTRIADRGCGGLEQGWPTKNTLEGEGEDERFTEPFYHIDND